MRASFVPEISLPESTAKLRAAVRAFLAEERERGTALDRPDSWFAGWDRDFSRRLAEHGWVGMTLPEEYGGGGRSPLERYVVIEELLAAGAPVAAHWVSDRQAGPSILTNGTDAQRERYLPAIARGECFFSIGMSEEGAGSDLAAVATRADQDDDGTWRLTGTKMWTGGSHVNDAAIVLARTDPDAVKHEGLSQFIVDLRAPEVEAEPILLLTGEHRFNATHLRGVPGDPLGTAGAGWRQVTGELGQERSGPERFLSTLALLRALLQARQDDLADHELARIGLLVARLAALRRLSLGVASALERGESPDVAAALVKDLGTRFEGDVVDTVRLLSPAVADPSAAPGSLAELLAVGIAHQPTYTLRGGTNEILRGIITKGLPDPVAADPPPRPAADATLAEEVRWARAVGAEPGDGPTVEALVARRALAAAGVPVPDGPLTVAWGDDLVVHDAGGGRVRLDGTLSRVPWGRCATTVVLTLGRHEHWVSVLDPADVVVVPGENLAREPRDTLTLDGLEVTAAPVAAGPLGAARGRLPLLRAAQISGAAQRASELAIAHVRNREQFGRALVAFQAVKQAVAELVEEVALVEAAVALGVERDDGFGTLAAKTQASASVAVITRIAHQLHGAIGVTERSPLRHATTRMWSWRDEYDTEYRFGVDLGRRAVLAGDVWTPVAG